MDRSGLNYDGIIEGFFNPPAKPQNLAPPPSKPGLGGGKLDITPNPQAGFIKLSLSQTVYLYNDGAKPDRKAKYVLVSLSGSVFSPVTATASHPDPQIAVNQSHGRGWYTETIEIQMGPQNPGGAGGLVLVQWAPQAKVQTGSFSSNISYGLDGGFFGLEPTGGGSVEISKNAEVDLTDFTLHDYSAADQMVRQTIDMSMTGDGNPYDPAHGAADLFINNIAGMRPLPSRAMENLDLSATQGLWIAEGHNNGGLVANPFNGVVTFDISIKATLRWGSWYPVTDGGVGTHTAVSDQWSVPIDFSTVNPPTPE